MASLIKQRALHHKVRVEVRIGLGCRLGLVNENSSFHTLLIVKFVDQ